MFCELIRKGGDLLKDTRLYAKGPHLLPLDVPSGQIDAACDHGKQKGQGLAEPGPCGACHLVHKAPNKLNNLWARLYGIIAEQTNLIDGLCASCHSKGNIAEKKIPAIAIHPAQKLLTTITTFTKEETNYSPYSKWTAGRKM